MKPITILLLLCLVLLRLPLGAQISQKPLKSGHESLDVSKKSAKENYINSQNYLSSKSLKDYKNQYGDSLKGFDEEKVKVELLNHGVYGEEYLNYIKTVKRAYIDAKYHLNQTPLSVPQNSVPNLPTSNAKPIGGNNSVNIAPCVNEDFESSTPGQYTTANAITGWTVSSQVANSCATNTVWTAGSPKFWIRQTPITGVPSIVNLGASPLGGSLIAQMNNTVFPLSLRTKLSTSFPVSLANTVFQFAYAGVYEDGGHTCCEQPALQIKMYDCLGNPMACSSLSLNAAGSGCPTGASGYSVTGSTSWTNWDVRYIDLTPYVGTCVTIEFINSDCIYSGHYGMTFIDARCGGQQIGNNMPGGPGGPTGGPVSYCAGSNMAQINAPVGYSSFQWYGPGMVPIVAPAGIQPSLVVTSPTPGAVYTVDLTTFSGCVFTATNAITISTVNIVGLGSSPSCIGGASGSATVAGNGSGSGYSYLWTNSTNSTVGTSAIASGLAPGVYSISISGIGSSGCGTAVSTVTISSVPPAVINLLKPFCGISAAYLGTNGGTNFQWYNGTTAITASLGGTAQNYTVNSPSNGSIMTLTYTSAQGCRDSVRYTLVSTPPGFVSSNTIPWVCPAATNGTAQINLAMAPGSPPGLNTILVNSTGTTAPFSLSMAASTTTNYILNGLAPGTYSVNAFDGSCFYTTNFSINAFNFNYTLTPNSPTLCPGNCIATGVNFGYAVSLNQFSYNWSPTTFLPGNNGTAQSTIICPSVALGSQATLIYTVVVTPSVVNCPITKTLQVTIINPATPTIFTIPELCNVSLPYQILTSTPGGTFNSGFAGINSPVNASSGVITPSHTNVAIGVNTFTYAISINTCVAKNTGTYEVSKFFTSALTSSVPPLCVTNGPFNLMNIVQNTVNGSWSGIGVTANAFIPSNLNTNVYTLTYSCFSSPNPLACPSNTSITVSVTKTITPLISPVSEFCTNAPPFTMTVNPSGGNWQTINGLNSLGLVNPNVITVNSMLCNYSVGIGPCINYASSVLNISRFNTAALTATVPHLCFNSQPFNLMSIVQSTTGGTWTGLSGVISNSFVSSGLSSSIYTAIYLTQSSPNASLCPDSKTIAVSVLNPATPTITPVSTLCNNAVNFQLSALPLDGNWTGSSYLNVNGVFTPSLSAIGNNAVQFVSGTNTCNVQQTVFISVEAFVPATILANIADLCNNSYPFNLSPITANNSGSWSGNGVSGNYFNPALSGAGTFNLLYSTSSSPSGLCPDVASTSVNVFSLQAPAISKAGPFCNTNLPVQLQVSPVGGLFGGANSGLINNSGVFNPANALVGTNLINYSITSGPCVAYAQTSILVEQFVSADFEKLSGPFCRSAQAVNMNSYVQNPIGQWSGPGIINNMFNPSLANVGNNSLIYTTYSLPSGTMCPDTSLMRIEVRDYPKVDAVVNIEAGCSPLEVVFNSPTINSGKGKWNIGNGKEAYTGLSLVHTFMTPGTYTAVFNYEDEIGCKALPAYAKPIVVYETPLADFNIPEEIKISDPKVQVINNTANVGNNHYAWKINNLPQASTEINPIFEFKKAGKYSVHLTSTSMHGCMSELSRILLVKNNFNIYIPNSFSPNFDGLNDEFKPVFAPYGLNESAFEMEITDRWGHSIFQSTSSNVGWNGTSKGSSEILPVGIYLYLIKFKDLEGNSYVENGHLNLIK
jgi:gliding motility-associated-like protein